MPVQSEIVTILGSFLDLESFVEVSVFGSTDLSRAEEVDAVVTTGLSGNRVEKKQLSRIFDQRLMAALKSCLCVPLSRALSHVHCAALLLHLLFITKRFLDGVLSRLQERFTC